MTPCNVKCIICGVRIDWHRSYGRDAACCSKDCYDEFDWRRVLSNLNKPYYPDPRRQCKHLKTERGKDIPRRYGSYQTEVCCICGAFRTMDHYFRGVSDWMPANEYERRIAATDDEE